MNSIHTAARAGRSASGPVRVAIVTNIPVPYREPVLEALAHEADLQTHVFYCSHREPDRNWCLAASSYRRSFLRERFLTIGGRFVHINFDIVPALLRFNPQVVITTGFNPTHLLAFAYARLFARAHVAMTDGTLDSERQLTGLHRIVRRIVFRGSHTFIGASEGSRRLYESYGISSAAFFKSALCADTGRFRPFPQSAKRADLLFCGRLIEDKSPLFALEVARATARRLGRRVSIVFAGAGLLESAVREATTGAVAEVDVRLCGFVQHEDLPRLYGEARVFLFPSRWDPWGVVANEAAAAGLPIIVSPHAGVAGELIVHEHNGYVVPLEVDRWANAAVTLLSDEDVWIRMSQAARAIVADYTFAGASAGIAAAVRAALPSSAPASA